MALTVIFTEISHRFSLALKITLVFYHCSSLWHRTFQKTVWHIPPPFPIHPKFLCKYFWQLSRRSLFWQKILAFTSPTCSVLSLFACFLSPQPLCWSTDRTAASEEQEMKLFFPLTICRLLPLSHQNHDSLQWLSLTPLMNSFCTKGECHLISAE